jgi:hypothetical protein
MKRHYLALLAALAALGATGTALADETPARNAKGAGGLEVTMRIIDDAAAISAEAVTRRIELPLERDGNGEPPADGADGPAVSEAAREAGRGYGEGAAERARELAERAGQQREEFGRSRAEERPEPPAKPDIQPPAPPRP